eukprot:1125120-Prymnesium_polylepis.1
MEALTSSRSAHLAHAACARCFAHAACALLCSPAALLALVASPVDDGAHIVSAAVVSPDGRRSRPILHALCKMRRAAESRALQA